MARAKAATSTASSAGSNATQPAKDASRAASASASPGDAEGEGEALRFEDALARLEGVVDRLEAGDLDLETSLAVFEEGVRLSRRCARQLDAAEQRVEVLVREAGSLTKRLFETGDAFDSEPERAEADGVNEEDAREPD